MSSEICKYCGKKDDNEMINCATCNGFCHPYCLELPENIVPVVKTYDWQCNDCKYCYECHNIENERKILFCDSCDRGYHTYCVKPKPLNRKPTGDWFCGICLENGEKEDSLVELPSPAEKKEKEKLSKQDSIEKVDIEEIPESIDTPSNVTDQDLVKTKHPEKVSKKSADKPSKRKSGNSGKPVTECEKNTATDMASTATDIDSPEDTPEPDNEIEDSPTTKKKKCLYGKKFGGEAKQCPFHGCDGTGNIRGDHNTHISLNNCPMSKESRKRERELMCEGKDELSPPQKKSVDASEADDGGNDDGGNNDDDGQKDNISLSQTPIENIVSRTDIMMFEEAKRKAEAVMCMTLDQEMAPNPDGLKSIIFGDVEIGAWYKSQYSLEFSRLAKLYICEFCLSYMKTETIYKRHIAKCTVRNPPGDEIYRKGNLSVFEVDGATATVYCQNLCLMAKLFLDHKTLWLDVAPFLFYIMTMADDRGCCIVGYFSKEKVSFLNYNVSCILVLPHHMKMGYGRLLIDFSYLLTAAEGKTGSPERPLSDMGLMSYRKFWAEKLLNYLSSYSEAQISIKSVSETMAIHFNDVISTLQYLGMLKYWKGKHLILLRKEVLEEYAAKVKERADDYKEIDPTCLTWTPANSK